MKQIRTITPQRNRDELVLDNCSTIIGEIIIQIQKLENHHGIYVAFVMNSTSIIVRGL